MQNHSPSESSICCDESLWIIQKGQRRLPQKSFPFSSPQSSKTIKLIEFEFSLHLEPNRQGSQRSHHNQRSIVRSATILNDILNDAIDEINEVFSMEVCNHFSSLFFTFFSRCLHGRAWHYQSRWISFSARFSSASIDVDGPGIFNSADDGSLYHLLRHSIIRTPFGIWWDFHVGDNYLDTLLHTAGIHRSLCGGHHHWRGICEIYHSCPSTQFFLFHKLLITRNEPTLSFIDGLSLQFQGQKDGAVVRSTGERVRWRRASTTGERLTRVISFDRPLIDAFSGPAVEGLFDSGECPTASVDKRIRWHRCQAGSFGENLELVHLRHYE